MSPLSPLAPSRPLNLLVAEPDDAFMLRLQIALRGVSTSSALYHVKSEKDLFAFLRKNEGWENAQQPDIIFLDTSLVQALDRIKSGNPFSAIPVILMGASMKRAQAVSCHARHANACLPKPADQAGMRALAAAIEAFWFKTAKLPPVKEFK